MFNFNDLPYHALVLMAVVFFAYVAKVLFDSSREREAARKILRDRYRFLEDHPGHNPEPRLPDALAVGFNARARAAIADEIGIKPRRSQA